MGQPGTQNDREREEVKRDHQLKTGKDEMRGSVLGEGSIARLPPGRLRVVVCLLVRFHDSFTSWTRWHVFMDAVDSVFIQCLVDSGILVACFVWSISVTRTTFGVLCHEFVSCFLHLIVV